MKVSMNSMNFSIFANLFVGVNQTWSNFCYFTCNFWCPNEKPGALFPCHCLHFLSRSCFNDRKRQLINSLEFSTLWPAVGVFSTSMNVEISLAVGLFSFLIPVLGGSSQLVTPIYKPWSSAIWKGFHNPILRGLTNSPMGRPYVVVPVAQML